MNRLLAAVAVVVAFAPTLAQAATSQATNTFSVPLRFDDAIAWYESHRVAVYQSSNCKLLADHGNREYLAQTATPIGNCRYIVRETDTAGQDQHGRRQVTYRVKFVRNVSGRVANQEVRITLTDRGDRTEVHMWMTTSVSGFFVTVGAVRNVQEGCLSGCQRYMTAHAR